MLARHLPPGDGDPRARRAMRLYDDEIRARRVQGPVARSCPRSTAAYDNNYGPISCRSWPRPTRVSGEQVSRRTATPSPATSTPGSAGAASSYRRAALQRTALRLRVSPRSAVASATASACRHRPPRRGLALGQTRGRSRRRSRRALRFMLVCGRSRTPPTGTRAPTRTAPARHQLRSGTVTVTFDDRMTPSVVEVGGTAPRRGRRQPAARIRTRVGRIPAVPPDGRRAGGGSPGRRARGQTVEQTGRRPGPCA